MSKIKVIEQYMIGEAARWKKEGAEILSPKDEVSSYIGDGKGYHLLSFTGLPKLGMNPKSHYNTPLGIYTYSMVDPWFEKQWEDQDFPFASDQPYIQIMRLRSERGLVVFSNSGISMGGSLISSLNKKYQKLITQGDNRAVGAHKMMLRGSEYWINEVAGGAREVRWYWAFTQHYASLIEGESGKPVRDWKHPGHIHNNAASIAVWSKVMVDDGIVAFDDRGTGTIHPDEPHQAVVLTMKAVQHVAQILNPVGGASQKLFKRGVKRQGRMINIFTKWAVETRKAFEEAYDRVEKLSKYDEISNLGAMLLIRNFLENSDEDNIKGVTNQGMTDFESNKMQIINATLALHERVELALDMAGDNRLLRAILYGESAQRIRASLNMVIASTMLDLTIDEFVVQGSTMLESPSNVSAGLADQFGISITASIWNLRFKRMEVNVESFGALKGLLTGMSKDMNHFIFEGCDIKVPKLDFTLATNIELGDDELENEEFFAVLFKDYFIKDMPRILGISGKPLSVEVKDCTFELV